MLVYMSTNEKGKLKWFNMKVEVEVMNGYHTKMCNTKNTWWEKILGVTVNITLKAIQAVFSYADGWVKPTIQRSPDSFLHFLMLALAKKVN